MKDIYVIIYVPKTIARNIITKDEYGYNKFNYKMFNIESYDCPYIDIENENNYYTFTITEDTTDLAGEVAYQILKYSNGKAYCTVGYTETTYKYKYTYQDDKLCVKGYTDDQLKTKTLQLASNFKQLNDYLSECILLSDDEDLEDKIDKLFEQHNSDYYNTYKIEKITNKPDILTLEWLFIEDYLKIMNIAKNKFVLKESKPLIFTKEYIYEEEQPKKQGFFELLFGKKKETSWKDKKFEQESTLWGLSKEDKRIAKEERMSPADFIEAEERDDDDLTTDEW